MSGVSPIKVGEYLLCGVPIIFSQNREGDSKLNQYHGFEIDEGLNQMDALIDWVRSIVIQKREKCRNLSRQIGLKNYTIERTICAYLGAIQAALE